MPLFRKERREELIHLETLQEIGTFRFIAQSFDGTVPANCLSHRYPSQFPPLLIPLQNRRAVIEVWKLPLTGYSQLSAFAADESEFVLTREVTVDSQRLFDNPTLGLDSAIGFLG